MSSGRDSPSVAELERQKYLPYRHLDGRIEPHYVPVADPLPKPDRRSRSAVRVDTTVWVALAEVG